MYAFDSLSSSFLSISVYILVLIMIALKNNFFLFDSSQSFNSVIFIYEVESLILLI